MKYNWRNEAWFDVAKLVLAAFLFASPWIFSFTSVTVASRSAWAGGILIGLASVWAIIAYADWQEWASVVLGLAVLIAPWAMNFHHTAVTAMRVDVSVGIAVVVIALANLLSMHSAPPRVTA